MWPDSWPSYRGPKDIDMPSLGDLAGDEFIGLIVAAFVSVVVLLLLLVFLLPALILLAEILFVLLVVAAGVAARLVLGHPWTVRARSSTGEQRFWQVRGYRNSGELGDAIAQALAAGDTELRFARELAQSSLR